MKSNVEIGSNSQGQSPTLATVLSSLTWGGSPEYGQYEGRADISATPPAAPAGGGAPAGSPPAAPAAPPAAPGQTPAGSPPAPAAGGNGNDNDANIRQLRQNYETLKPWEKVATTVKDPTVALTAVERYNNGLNEALKVGQQLGYTPESIRQAFNEDPYEVLAHLRGEFAKANPQHTQSEAFRKQAEAAARNVVKPIEERLNQQATDAAMRLYDTEFNRLLADDKLGFGKDLPKEMTDALNDLVWNMVPDEVLTEIKMDGKVSGIQKYFDQAKQRFLATVNAYNSWMQKSAVTPRTPGRGPVTPPVTPANGGQQQKALTLDDILNNPEENLPGLKAGKY